MRILMLTQYYTPEPASMFADLARSLSRRGHTVQVITGFPCYPQGRTYAGYRQGLDQEETSDGVYVTRLPQFPDHSRSAIRRALYYLSFALSAATIGLWRARRADVLLVYQAAFPVGLAAWVISRVRRMPYVLDVVDLWPESVAASGMMRNPYLLSIVRRLMKFIYHGAERISVITEGYRDNLIAHGVPAKKLSLIHCWPADQPLEPAPYDAALARREELDARFNVMYAGTMGPVQDLKVVIEAAELLRDLPSVQFVLVGDGVEYRTLLEQANRSSAANVRLLGRKSADELHRLYPLADALLVHLKTDALSSVSIPSKTFGYLAAGRPILMAVEGEAARLVERHGCGLAVRPSDPQSLSVAVRKLVAADVTERQRMARAARATYETYYRPELQIGKFESLLEAVCTPRTAPLRQAA